MCLKKIILVSLLYPVLFCLFLFACGQQVVLAQESQLTNLSLSIREELRLLKEESLIMNVELQNLNQYLEERTNALSLSEEEQRQSQIELIELTSSFTSMSKRYSESLVRVIQLEERIRRQNIMITIFATLGILFLISNIVATVIMVKRKTFSWKKFLLVWT